MRKLTVILLLFSALQMQANMASPIDRGAMWSRPFTHDDKGSLDAVASWDFDALPTEIFKINYTPKISLTIVFNSGYFLNELVSPGGMNNSCSMWTLQEFTLLDSLQNEIQKEVRWCRGIETRTAGKLQFDNIKAASLYYLQYSKDRHLEMDTIRLKAVKSQEITIELNEEASQNAAKKPTFIEHLNEGDTLFIKFREYACNATKGEFMIMLRDGKYNAALKETMGSIHKNFHKDDIGDRGLEIIKAFEWDGRRRIYRNNCNDMGNYYTLSYKDQILRIADFCGVWDGYFLLKKGLFRD